MASQNGHVEVARLLLDRGAAVDAARTVRDGERKRVRVGGEGETAAHACASR